MKLALLTFKNNKVTITDPREGHSPESFEAKDIEKASERLNAINAEIVAAATPRTGIELLSRDGQPINGVATKAASDAAVFITKAKKAGETDKITTERDLCDVTGYVLVSRDHGGKVRAEWGNPPDFGRYTPITTAGIDALRGMFSGQ